MQKRFSTPIRTCSISKSIFRSTWSIETVVIGWISLFSFGLFVNSVESVHIHFDKFLPFVAIWNYTGLPKKLAHFFLRLINPSNIDKFSNFFHCQNQKTISDNTITKDSTTPQMCRYTTLWNVSVLKATIENKTTFVSTLFYKINHSKQLVYCLSYCLK